MKWGKDAGMYQMMKLNFNYQQLIVPVLELVETLAFVQLLKESRNLRVMQDNLLREIKLELRLQQLIRGSKVNMPSNVTQYYITVIYDPAWQQLILIGQEELQARILM